MKNYLRAIFSETQYVQSKIIMNLFILQQTVLYWIAKEVSSIHESIFTKYNDVTLDNLSYSQIEDGAYWIVTIFLTFYDPHIIRIPTNGNVNRLDLPAFYSENKAMLDIENKLLNNNIANIKQELLASISFNQRVLLNIKPPLKKENYHIILTADYDIDTVVSFFSKPEFFKQNKRIASVRYGSMATCILPKEWNINPLQKTKHSHRSRD
ncbi:Phosphatidylserine decarboxylase [Sphingobacterium daejeonense]|nr:Phosphatidylserine decarboxylase [Sphingobacterium daejeonense]